MLLAAIPRAEQRRIVRFFTAVPGVTGILVALFGAVELALAALRLIPPSKSAMLYVMPPLTAITCILTGFALTAAQRTTSATWKWVARFLAIVVGVIGL